MDYKDIQPKTDAELRQILGEHQERLRRLRFSASERQLKNVREIRTEKRVIARIETALRQKQTKS